MEEYIEKDDWITKAIERQAIPKALRKETVEEFCAINGVSVANFYYHLSKPENQQRVLDILLRTVKDSAPEILEKLVEKAKEGDMKAIDTYLDSVLKLAKNIDLTSKGKALPVLVQFMECARELKDNTNPTGV